MKNLNNVIICSLVFSVFDFFAGFTQLILHPDAIPLTAFCTSNGLYEWLRMPPGAAGVPACFACVMLLAKATLDRTQTSLADAIGSDDSLINYEATLAALLARLRPHK